MGDMAVWNIHGMHRVTP